MFCLKCVVCPHECLLAPGQTGKCRVRRHVNGKIETGKFFGRCSAIAVDQIEKRPFFHLMPGTKWLSISFFGCNLFCEWCANGEVSQKLDGKYHHYTPEDLIKLAIEKRIKGIVFSYTEPTVHYEYLREVGHHILSTDLSLAIKTNGFVSQFVLRELAMLYDAFNVDIKGNEDFYKQHNASLEDIKKSIELLVRMKVWVEVSYLVTPQIVDDFHFHQEMAQWLASLDYDIPLHLLFFYPYPKINGAAYEKEKLLKIREVMRKYLRYVYVSNLFDSSFSKYRGTTCPRCDEMTIRRDGQIDVFEIECCGQKLPGIIKT